MALRLRDRFDVSRPSSIPGVEGRGECCGTPKPTIGEYERRPGVGAGEKEDTWRSMTNSCVAFVSRTIFVRSVDESGFALAAPAAIDAAGVEPAVVPRVLSARDSWMTVCRTAIERRELAFRSQVSIGQERASALRGAAHGGGHEAARTQTDTARHGAAETHLDE